MTAKRILGIFLVFTLCASVFFAIIPMGHAQGLSYLWDWHYGGTRDDVATSVINTTDGGYAVAGYITNSYGHQFGVLLKISSNGTMLWRLDRPNSNTLYDSAFTCVVQTSDGGYALSGVTNNQAWLVKTDSNGNFLWEKILSHSSWTWIPFTVTFSCANSLAATSDGGVFVVGYGSFIALQGVYPFIIERTIFCALYFLVDASGNVLARNFVNYQWWETWSATSMLSVSKTSDGGYVAAGLAVEGDFSWPPLSASFALWKFNHDGTLAWVSPKLFSRGSGTNNRAFGVVQADDGGYVICGITQDKWPPWDWPTNILVLKTNADGILQWTNRYLISHSWACGIVKMADGGYAIAGWTDAYPGYGKNAMLMQIGSAGGAPSSVRIFGGTQDEEAYSLTPTGTGGFLLAGYTKSYGNGGKDMYMVDVGPSLTVSITPPSAAIHLGNSITFSSLVSGGTPSYSYQWYLYSYQSDSIAPISGATSSALTFTPSLAGYYLVSLKITDNNADASWSNPAPVSVSDLAVSIYPSSVTMDVPQMQTFASDVSGGTLPYSYRWLLNGSQVLGATSSTWSFQPSAPGNSTIALQVTDSTSLTVFSNNASVTVNPDLIVNINPGSATTTVGIPQTFSSSVSGGTAPYSYEWYANDILVLGESSESISFTPSEIGTYKIYLKVTDNVGLTKKSNEAWLAVHAHPVANFTWSPLVPMVSDVVTFDGSASTPDGGTSVSYSWDFGDGGTGSGETATHTYSAWGNYTVTLNVTDDEALWDIKQQQIQVVPTVKYTIIFYTSPSSIGSITFDGTAYTNGQSGQYTAGFYSVSANPPQSWSFDHWQTTGGVTISSPAQVTGDGTITAVFKSTSAPPSVGGEWSPIDSIQPLTLCIGLAATMAIAASFIGVKRIKKRQD